MSSAAPEVDGATRLRLAVAVEELGFDSLWLADHPVASSDCWTGLAAFAAVTSRVRLGPLVACVFYRSAFSLARQAADVDRLSGGRLVLGVGTGSTTGEFAPMGLQAPSNAERRRALDEALAAVRRLWDGEPFTFIPAENRFTGHALVHGPVQQPRVPLLIGGAGEKVTLRRVAEQADACNFVNATPDEVRRKYDVLRAHCEAVGRPYDTILRSHLLNVVTLAPTESAALTKLNLLEGWKRDRAAKFAMTPEQLIRFYDPLIRAGVQYVIPSLTRYDDLETLELLAELVVPELQAIANV